MIGIDTNTLIRVYVTDDPAQVTLVRRFMNGLDQQNPGYVSMITLVEFIWTLKNRYRVEQSKLGELVNGLLQSRDIIFEDEETVETAMEVFSKGKAELPGLLIALRNRKAGCRHTVTFDKSAARNIPGMELLS